MDQIFIFILGMVVGGGIVKLLDSRFRGNDREEKTKKNLIEQQAEEKRQNKEAILGILETQSPLTNNHVEQLLGISDATAERYLQELENEGRVRQVGKTGQAVFYEKI